MRRSFNEFMMAYDPEYYVKHRRSSEARASRESTKSAHTSSVSSASSISSIDSAGLPDDSPAQLSVRLHDSAFGMDTGLLHWCASGTAKYSPLTGLSAKVASLDVACEEINVMDGTIVTKHAQERVSDGDKGSSVDIGKEIDTWDFPMFRFCRDTDGHPLYTIAQTLFDKENLFDTMQIDRHAFRAFFMNLEKAYLEVPYHNRLHGADVLHGVGYLLRQPILGFPGRHMSDSRSDFDTSKQRLLTRIRDLKRQGASDLDLSSLHAGDVGCLKSALSPLQLMGCLIAAAGHDVQHPGRTGSFLEHTNHPIASLYEKDSMLERHHVAMLWQLLEKDNFLEALPPSDFEILRKLIETMILATDIVRGKTFNSQWANLHTATAKTGLCLHCPDSSENLELVLCMMIRLADVGAGTKSRQTHLKWATLLYHEFDAQVADELDLGFTPHAFMDPKTRVIPETQITFLQHFVETPYRAYHDAGFLPGPYVIKQAEISDDEDSPEDDDDAETQNPLAELVESRLLLDSQSHAKYWGGMFPFKPIPIPKKAAKKNLGAVSEDETTPSSSDDETESSSVRLSCEIFA